MLPGGAVHNKHKIVPKDEILAPLTSMETAFQPHCTALSPVEEPTVLTYV